MTLKVPPTENTPRLRVDAYVHMCTDHSKFHLAGLTILTFLLRTFHQMPGFRTQDHLLTRVIMTQAILWTPTWLSVVTRFSLVSESEMA